MIRYASMTACALLSGCATITTLGNTFEGAADYRIIPVCAPQSGDGSKCSTVAPLIAPAVQLSQYNRFQQHPNSDQQSQFFSKGEYLQINLKSGAIGWFSEGVEQRILNELISPISQSRMKGEIAIIANVTEKTLSPGGLGADGNLEGRVVFYSDDIYTDQRLNEFNIPIFGPYKYEGGPLSIDLWMMELDRAESDQMGAVLETLTSLAGKIPSVAGAGIDILGQIGTAFLKSNADDVIGHVRLTLSPPRAKTMAMDPILQVSDIVISRAANRSERHSFFDKCYYHPASGRVTADKGEQSKACGATLGPDGDNNIFVLGIRKVEEGPDISSAVQLAELTDRITKANKSPDLSKAIDAIGDEARSGSAYSASMEALDRLRGTPAPVVRDSMAETILLEMQCTLLAARFDGKKVQENVCGPRATARAMSMADFAKLSKHLSDRLQMPNGGLTLTSLLGDTLKDDAGADVLKKKREELYSYFVYKKD